MSTPTTVSSTVIPARAAWSCVVRTGETLTITDLHGNQAVDFLVYDAHDTSVRYSAPDTIHAQGTIFLTTGSVLMSNEHTPLMTVAADEVGRHDTVGGACSKESNTLRYGHHTWSQHACVDNFLAEGARHGLGKRDLVSNINWYMNVPVEKDGTLGIVDGLSAPGLKLDPARRARRPRAGLQLPPDQQPLQRLRPDGRGDDDHRGGPRRMTFDTLLVANRGEIAVRIIRTARELGLRTVAVYSDPDRSAPHVRLADEAVRLGPAPAKESYLDADLVLKAAKDTGAGAIHPGYGFLSEDAAFARRCEDAGIVFVGPTPEQLELFGAKHTARAAAEAAGVPLAPGTGLLRLPRRGARAGRRDRLPVMLKATGGGGGIGMSACRSADELDRRLGTGAARRRRLLLLRRRLPGTARRARPPCRGAGLRRRRGQGRHLRRPRLLPAAPQPEGRGGGPGTGPARPRTRTTRHIRPRLVRVRRLPLRRHRRVRLRRRPRGGVLPGGQHPPPGGASGHRGDLRRRPRRLDAAPGPRRAGRRTRTRAHRAATPSRPASTPRTPRANTGPARAC